MIVPFFDRFGLVDWSVLAGSYNLASSVLFYFFTRFCSVISWGIDNRSDFFPEPDFEDLPLGEVPF